MGKEIKCYIGQRFGKLLVTEGLELNTSRNKPNKYKKYKCLCDCKKEAEIYTSQLNKGVKSCGCLRVFLNLTDRLKPGMKINRFTVVGFNEDKLKWELLCDCGNTYFSGAKRILRSNTKSCGCLNFESRQQKAIHLINKKTDPNFKEVLRKNIFKARYNDGTLTFEEFKILIDQPCFYCGAEKTNSKIKKPSKHSYLYKLSIEELTLKYNGIDRINSFDEDLNRINHNSNMCVSSCYICNHAKSDMKYCDFTNYLSKIKSHEVKFSLEEYRELHKTIPTDHLDNPNNFSILKSIRSVMKRYSDIDFDLKTFYQLSQLNCYYCGSKPLNKLNRAKHIKKSSQYAKDTGDYIYNGLDRILSSDSPDSNVHSLTAHNYSNIIPACYRCNRAKNHLSFDEFMAWIKRIKEFERKPL